MGPNMTTEGNRKMARTPAELAANNLKTAKSRVRTLERRFEVSKAQTADLEAKLERSRKLLKIAQEHPDLEVASTDSHVAGHHPPPASMTDSGSSGYADGHDPATYSDDDVATHRAVAAEQGDDES